MSATRDFNADHSLTMAKPMLAKKRGRKMLPCKGPMFRTNVSSNESAFADSLECNPEGGWQT